jgi:hypothetical protein
MMAALFRILDGGLDQKLLSSWSGPQNQGGPEEAAPAFDEIKRILSERLGQALRIQQALERGVPEQEVQAEGQKYLEALEGWNAALKSLFALITDAEPGVALLPDALFCRGYIGNAAMFDQLRRRRRRLLKPAQSGTSGETVLHGFLAKVLDFIARPRDPKG